MKLPLSFYLKQWSLKQPTDIQHIYYLQIINLILNTIQPRLNHPLCLYSCNTDPLHGAGSPRKANRPSPIKGIPCILWSQRVHYHIHKIPWMVPILNQINLVNPFPSYLFRISRCPAESRTYSQIQQTCSYNLYYAI